MAFYKFLMDWQTLIGSIGAVIAAIWTIREMQKQSRGDETRHEDERSRKRMAARAQMPDALSEMSGYVRASCRYLILGETIPQPPVAALNTLKSVIEYIDTREATKTFELVSWYQVQHARLVGSKKPKALETAEMLYDATLLQCQVNRLFDYARNEEEKKRPEKPTRDEMTGSLKNAVTLEVWAMRNGEFKEVIEMIKRRHEPEKAGLQP